MTDAPAPQRTRARPMTPEDRRRAIIAATVPLLAEHGGSVTTRQIAEAADVAEGTIFRVFPDKRALFLAVAEDLVNPPGGRDDMAAQLADVEALHEKIALVVERLAARHEQVMSVMMALRSTWLSQGPPKHGHKHDPGAVPGPPAFVVESNRQLLANLTDLLFLPHAAELRVPAEQAALVLRSLVFGAWHPGMPAGEQSLGPREVADIVLRGVGRAGGEG